MADPNSYVPQSGMTQPHFAAFQDVAQEQGVIAVVRNTNVASTKLIEQGCPGKPLTIKFHTSETTGVVTAANPSEVAQARQLGFYVVDADKVARGPSPELRLANTFWRLEPGQIIDPKTRKPLVGDYDLMGVFSAKNPGQNIALVSSNGKPVADVMSPIVRTFADGVNARLDRPRVLHGAQDQFAGFRGGATAFLPDGRVVFLADETAVRDFYNSVGRQPRTGTYNPPVIPGSAIVGQSGKLQGVLRNQAAMAMIGQMLGGAIQSLGDIGIQRQIQHELETTHANAITDILARGEGVLIIIRLNEWLIPDFNGMRARAFHGVYIQGGPTQDAALESWRKPVSVFKSPPLGWRSMPEQYVWIDPVY